MESIVDYTIGSLVQSHWYQHVFSSLLKLSIGTKDKQVLVVECAITARKQLQLIRFSGKVQYPPFHEFELVRLDSWIRQHSVLTNPPSFSI